MKYIETNESRILRAEIKAALENLLYICNKNAVGFCGFVFGDNPPLMIRFGNVKEKGEEFTTLLAALCVLVEEREADGRVINDPLTGVN